MIKSNQNNHFKRWRFLLESRGIKKQNQYLLSGRKLVPEWLQQNTTEAEVIYFEKQLPFALNQNIKTHWLDKKLFDELDIFGTQAPLYVGLFNDFNPYSPNQPKGLELVCALSDPANLGALLRSAEAFQVHKVILLNESVHPYHPKCLRSSSGSALRLTIETGPSIKKWSQECVALEASGQSINDFNWPKNVRVIVGEEGQGLPDNIKGQKLKIPMSRGMDSLNASVAASIALYAYHQMVNS